MTNIVVTAKTDKRLFLRQYGTVIGALAIFAVFSVMSENFLRVTNLLMLLRQMSMLTIVSLGFTFVMAAGGFDMSIGNAVGLVNIILALVLIKTKNVLLSMLVALALGMGIGCINGLLVAYVGLADFIATFAVGSIVYGLKMLITKGNPIFFDSSIPSSFFFIGQGYVGPIPLPVILMMIFVVIGIYILDRTALGRRVYAIGGNPVASLYAGIDIKKHRLITFIISGLTMAIAAVILTSRLGSAQPLAGEEFMLDAIAVVFLSTTMFGDGECTGKGTFVGALIISMLTNGLTMLNVPYYFQYITKGLVVIFAVVLSIVLGQRSK
ncbi:MAG TPA: ABC transporter permease [Firmicutes bacterium]|nr:ABC transporter permease [Bacillota bacterium]